MERKLFQTDGCLLTRQMSDRQMTAARQTVLWIYNCLIEGQLSYGHSCLRDMTVFQRALSGGQTNSLHTNKCLIDKQLSEQ